MSEIFEQEIQRIAQDMHYPAMKRQVQQYRPVYRSELIRRVAIALFVVGLVGFAIPDIRAKVLDILHIGQVTITLDSVGLNGKPLFLRDVYGETDLATIEESVSFDVRVPVDDLPDRVYLQDGELVIFVWLEDEEIVQALYQVPDFDWGIYKQVPMVTDTTINGNLALWVTTRHPVQFVNRDEVELSYFVQGNVLIWAEEDVTYRLETELDMEAARAFAESLVTPP